MSISSPLSRYQVFVSYARADRGRVERIVELLRAAGIPTWRDDAIQPGAPSWEDAIRAAVAESFAVVLACSPASARSSFVQAEFLLGKDAGCEILPCWIDGDRWVDCVPLELASYQYLDCRNQDDNAGPAALVARLRSLLKQTTPALTRIDSPEACPKGSVLLVVPAVAGASVDLEAVGRAADEWWRHQPLQIPDSRLVAAALGCFSNFEEFLDCLYTAELRDHYPPFTYGAHWILAKASHYASLLAVPWEWLCERRARPLAQVLPDYRQRCTPFSAYGMGYAPRAVWVVADRGFQSACGLFTSRDDLACAAFSSNTKGLLLMLSRAERVPLASVHASNYRYRLVLVVSEFVRPPWEYVFVLE